MAIATGGYNYFLSYAVERSDIGSGVFGFGWRVVTLPQKIDDAEVVKEVSNAIEEASGFKRNSVSIISFQLLD